jgi:hypothetical protein
MTNVCDRNENTAIGSLKQKITTVARTNEVPMDTNSNPLEVRLLQLTPTAAMLAIGCPPG